MFDLHALFRAPDYLRGPIEWYMAMSRDPLVGGASGAFGDSSQLAWFKSFLILEWYRSFSLHLLTKKNLKYFSVFQLPVFFLGIRGLYKGFYFLPISTSQRTFFKNTHSIPPFRFSHNIPPPRPLRFLNRHHHPRMLIPSHPNTRNNP